MSYPDLQPDFHDSVLPQVGHALPTEPVQTTFIHIHRPQNLAQAPPQLRLSDAGECRSKVRSLEDEPRYASTMGSRSKDASDRCRSTSRAPVPARQDLSPAKAACSQPARLGSRFDQSKKVGKLSCLVFHLLQATSGKDATADVSGNRLPDRECGRRFFRQSERNAGPGGLGKLSEASPQDAGRYGRLHREHSRAAGLAADSRRRACAVSQCSTPATG